MIKQNKDKIIIIAIFIFVIIISYSAYKAGKHDREIENKQEILK